MASSSLIIFSFLLLATSAAAAAANSNKEFESNLILNPATEKSTHLHFYMHDTPSGPNPTVVRVVRSPSNATAFAFGAIDAIDDALTEGPNVSSGPVGRAQGLYSLVSQNGEKILWTVNFLFTTGEYNGSSIAVVGSDDVPLPVREVAVVGGTGRFRLARGYVLVRTYWEDSASPNAILEVDVYVWHH